MNNKKTAFTRTRTCRRTQSRIVTRVEFAAGATYVEHVTLEVPDRASTDRQRKLPDAPAHECTS
jgi:hypothetical protein